MPVFMLHPIRGFVKKGLIPQTFTYFFYWLLPDPPDVHTGPMFEHPPAEFLPGYSRSEKPRFHCKIIVPSVYSIPGYFDGVACLHFTDIGRASRIPSKF